MSFYKIQKKLVIQTIHRAFVTQPELLLDDAKERGKADLLGDGYNAKYGTYIVIDKQTDMIMGMHVSHIDVASNSAIMELDGLENLLQRLYDSAISISSLTTDMDKQVRYFLRRNQKDIQHQFDVWNFVKNIKGLK